MTVTDLDQLCAADGSWVRRSVITDPELHELERRKIFGRCWLVVAHESQIPEPDDYVTGWMGEEPVVVARDRRGDIHVTLNSCSHRASKVCRADRGNARVFTCPNHGWQFDNTGRLLGLPQITDGYPSDLDREQLSLVAAKRVAVFCGFVFATFDADAPDLLDYLGDAARFLEVTFGRYEGGMEVLEGSQRSLIDCNWKLAAENLGTDLQHPEVAHGAFMDVWPDETMAFMKASEQIVLRDDAPIGHSICIGRRPPPATEAHLVVPMIEDPDRRAEVQDWYDTTNAAAAEAFGIDLTDLYVFTGSVFPNLSFLPGVSAVYVCHPRGPLQMEWQSWCLVPKSAPPEVKAVLRQRFLIGSGPGGIILAEDAENWADMTKASSSPVAEERPLHIGRGLGDEYRDPALPGVFAPMRSEHVQRNFWVNWRAALEAP